MLRLAVCRGGRPWAAASADQAARAAEGSAGKQRTSLGVPLQTAPLYSQPVAPACTCSVSAASTGSAEASKWAHAARQWTRMSAACTGKRSGESEGESERGEVRRPHAALGLGSAQAAAEGTTAAVPAEAAVGMRCVAAVAAATWGRGRWQALRAEETDVTHIPIIRHLLRNVHHLTA